MGIEKMLWMYLLQIWFHLYDPATGRMLKGGTIVDATIINAPSSTKNAQKVRNPEMHQTKKGNEWRFGMKCHVGVGAHSGIANAHDITQAAALIRKDGTIKFRLPGHPEQV